MICSNCGCPLTEGFSKFCPECGTPVKQQRKISQLVSRIILGVLLVLSVAWIAFPVIRAGGDKITGLSALDIIVGKKNFDGMKISAMPYLLPVFLLPQIICMIPVCIKKINIHRVFSFIGTFQLYRSVVLVVLWAVLICISSFYKGIYGYGLGIVIDIAATLLTAFVCIAFSASQESDTSSRSEDWLTTISIFNIILLCLTFVLLVLVNVFTDVLGNHIILTVMVALSVISGVIAYFKMFRGEYNQWLLLPVHAVLTLISHIILITSASPMLKAILGEQDFLDIYGFVAPIINPVITAVAVFAFVYNTAVCVWSYKALKRHQKILKERISKTTEVSQ